MVREKFFQDDKKKDIDKVDNIPYVTDLCPPLKFSKIPKMTVYIFVPPLKNRPRSETGGGHKSVTYGILLLHKSQNFKKFHRNYLKRQA
jgi:hypothetical protein